MSNGTVERLIGAILGASAYERRPSLLEEMLAHTKVQRSAYPTAEATCDSPPYLGLNGHANIRANT